MRKVDEASGSPDPLIAAGEPSGKQPRYAQVHEHPLFLEHFREIVKSTYRLARWEVRHDDALDVAGQSAIAVLNKLARDPKAFAGERKLIAYAVSVAIHLLRDFRVLSEHQGLSGMAFHMEWSSMEERRNDPHVRAEMRELWGMVREVLAAMPADRRLAVTLVRLDGFRPAEAAAKLNTAVVTVRKWLVWADAEFRPLYEAWKAGRRYPAPPLPPSPDSQPPKLPPAEDAQ
jgi:DNA-directed RNA polymerase specialized sigma24 family protein